MVMREDDISYRKQPPAQKAYDPEGVCSYRITVPCLVGATSSLRSTSFGNVPILFDRDLEVAPTGITLLLPGGSLLLYALCPMLYALCKK
jgi:hypothetical protein